MKDKLDNVKPEIYNIIIILNIKKKIEYIIDKYVEDNVYEYVSDNLYEGVDKIINLINYKVYNFLHKKELSNCFLQKKYIKEII